MHFVHCKCKANLISNLRWKQSTVFKELIEKMGVSEAKKRKFI